MAEQRVRRGVGVHSERIQLHVGSCTYPLSHPLVYGEQLPRDAQMQ